MNDKLITVARTQGTPIIDGDQVTFLWQGNNPPALVGDFTDWQIKPLPLVHLENDLWGYTTTFPSNAYLEYTFFDSEKKERLLDGLNPRKVRNGMGQIANYFYMPEAIACPYIHPNKGAKINDATLVRVKTHDLAVGKERSVSLYQPSTSEPVPLLVVLDGNDYQKMGKIVSIVDNLISQSKIQPIALALVSHGRQARFVEYAASESTLLFLTEIVLPFAQQKLNLIDIQHTQGAYGILGASMGGLMALYCGLRAPQIFGRVLSQSGAFDFGYDSRGLDEFVRYIPTKPIRIWMDAGRYEWLLPSNQRMAELLKERGYSIAYKEFSGGHNYTSWRNELPYGLMTLFPESSTVGSIHIKEGEESL